MTTPTGTIVHDYNSGTPARIVAVGKSIKIDQIAEPYLIMVHAQDGRMLMRIDPDGNYHGELADASEAARLFCEKVQEHMRRYAAARG